MPRATNRHMRAGKYTNRITIIKKIPTRQDDGLDGELRPVEIVTCFADIRTTRGYAIAMNDSDFELAYVKFSIAYCQKVVDAYFNGTVYNAQGFERTTKRNLFVVHNNIEYEVKYLDNVDLKNIEIEMQTVRVTGYA